MKTRKVSWMEHFTREQKYKPVRVAVVTFVILVMVAVLSLVVASRSSTPEKAAFTPTGYYNTPTGIFDASTKTEVLLGSYMEFVRTEKYLLAVSNQGVLTLLSLADNKMHTITGKKDTAHQLKVVDGDKFGFLQLKDDSKAEIQSITILDPSTGATSSVPTSENLIAWDAEGSDLIYMPNATSILHHVTYRDGVWGKDTILGENISSIGSIFIKGKQPYVQVLADISKVKVISLDTFTDMTKDFPIVEQLGSLGTISQIVDGYWFVTAPTESIKISANKVSITSIPADASVIVYSQLLLDKNSTLLYDFTPSGYESQGISSLNTDGSVLNVPVSLAGSGERGVLFIDTKTNTVINFLNSALNYLP